jgi:hypothetical protein
VKTKGMNPEIKTAGELIRIAFAWSYAEDSAAETALEEKLKRHDRRSRPGGAGPPRLAIRDAGTDVQALRADRIGSAR